MPLKPPPPLETQRLRLRLVEQGDIGELFQINGDDAVTRFLPYATWQSTADGEAWFDRMFALNAIGATLQFVIVERNTDSIIGTCLLFRHDEENARAELGYAMKRIQWNKGFTYEALSALITYAFEVYALRRLEAEVDPLNIASNQLLLKLGFSCEGLLRQRWIAKGRPYDTHIYGLLRDEWTHHVAYVTRSESIPEIKESGWLE